MSDGNEHSGRSLSSAETRDVPSDNHADSRGDFGRDGEGGVRAPETGRGWPVFVSDTVGSWWLQVSKLSKCLARAKKQRIAEEREHPDRARLAVGLG